MTDDVASPTVFAAANDLGNLWAEFEWLGISYLEIEKAPSGAVIELDSTYLGRWFIVVEDGEWLIVQPVDDGEPLSAHTEVRIDAPVEFLALRWVELEGTALSGVAELEAMSGEVKPSTKAHRELTMHFMQNLGMALPTGHPEHDALHEAGTRAYWEIYNRVFDD